jgi:trans-aconitate methyltransferase
MTISTRTEWNAQVYHQVSNPHVSWGAKVIDRIAPRGDETVADLGCGTGRITAQLLERLPAGRVIAVDRSANMLEEARTHLEPRFPGQVAYVQADLLDTGPETIGGSVDLAFSTATFHWVLDHDRLFANIFSLLRPGGRLVAQCGGGPNLKRQVDRAEAMMGDPPFREHFAGWTSPKFYADALETAERLRNAGFLDVETSITEAPTILGDADEFATYLANVIFREHLQQLPDPALQETFVAGLTRLAADDDPPFSLDYWRLDMRGTRPAR